MAMNKERFWSRVDKSGDCWLWTGCLDPNGYGKYSGRKFTGKSSLAHRIAYELVKGAIPEGLTLDHLCKVHNCVNPEHLEPVLSGVNVLRGDTIPARNRAKTHCIHGHAFSDANLMWVMERQYRIRRCRTCVNMRRKRYYYRDKSKSQGEPLFLSKLYA